MAPLPNFLYIGPDKSGSTWIHRILLIHPEIYMSPVKDIYFFDKNYERGFKWYSNFFKGAKDEKIRGEVSHDYLFSSNALHRIYSDLPDVKLMVCLREPVERAFSAYLYLIKHGMTKENFSEAIERFPHLLEQSKYAKYLGPYLNKFGKEKLFIGVFDELKNNPEGFINNVFKFLDIPQMEISKKMLENCFPASRPRNAWLAFLAKKTGSLCRKTGSLHVLGYAKKSRLISSLLYVPYNQSTRPVVDEQLRIRLKDFFRQDIEELDALTGGNFKQKWNY